MASDRRHHALSRRDFVAGLGKAAAVGIVAPFTFVRRAAARTDALRRFLVKKLAEANTPGIAVAVVRPDEVVWSAGVGWADKEHGIRVTRETAFQLASVSKTMTCAGIMALVQDGVLDLDTDINEYLPFEVHVPKTPNVSITMRMLLTHTSAIRDRDNVWGTPWSTPSPYFHGDSPISLGSFCRSYFAPDGSRYERNGNFYERAPGTRYAYFQPGGRTRGLRRRVGQRNGLRCLVSATDPPTTRDDRLRLSPRGHPRLEHRDALHRFAPGLRADLPVRLPRLSRRSPPDERRASRPVAGFLHELRIVPGARVLDVDTVKEIRRNQVPDVVSWLQGLIWYGDTSSGFLTLGHTGGDFGESTRMFFRPDRRVGVVTLTNSYLNNQNWASFQRHRGAALRSVRLVFRTALRTKVPRSSGRPPSGGSRSGLSYVVMLAHPDAGGGGVIRTREGWIRPLTAFEAVPFVRSGTPPWRV